MAVKKITHGRGTSYEVTAKVDGRTVRKRFARKDLALDFQAQVRQAVDDLLGRAADWLRTAEA